MQHSQNPCLIASTTCKRLSKNASRVQGPGTSAAQSEELRVAAARLLAAQAMVQEGSMAGAARRGPVAGWPSPSNSPDDAAVSTLVKKVSRLTVKTNWPDHATFSRLLCICISKAEGMHMQDVASCSCPHLCHHHLLRSWQWLYCKHRAMLMP